MYSRSCSYIYSNNGNLTKTIRKHLEMLVKKTVRLRNWRLGCYQYACKKKSLSTPLYLVRDRGPSAK